MEESDKQDQNQDRWHILVIDDEAVIREGMRRILEKGDIRVESSSSGRMGIEKVQEQDFDVVITDLKMPGMDGLEVLRNIKILQPDVPVIIITGYSTVDTAVEAMKCGAFDYIAKPFTPQQITEKVQKAIARKIALTENNGLKKEICRYHGFDNFIGESPEMQKVYHRILQVAPTDSTVLINGESGTGKELVARAIHQKSLRHDHSFVAVDCTSLAENLLESELFGHVKGSFTGALQSKTGLFKVADGGTLFLDEISNISLTTQAKLLRVLQERVVTPIGDICPVPIDIRLIASTNKDLGAMVAEGAFRDDLLYRIKVIPVNLPPLRERRGDIPLLINHFLRKFAEDTGRDIRGFEPGTLEFLERYDFPGNVRELENIIERSVVLCEGAVISRADMELHFEKEERFASPTCIPHNLEELKETKKQLREQAVEPVEKAFVLNALKRNNWNISQAAEETGMLRTNFHALMKKLGISAKYEQKHHL